MRGAAQNSNFVAEFAAKRAAQLERARQLREERKRTVPEAPQDRPASGSPMTYARSNRDDEPTQPSRPSSGTSGTDDAQWQRSAPMRNEPRPELTRGEIKVTEDDFRRAVKQGIITPDQARQLWGVLADPSSGARMESFKRAQVPTAYDPSIYGTERAHGSALIGDARKPNSVRPEWNSDSTSDFNSFVEERKPSAPTIAGSRKVAGASYSVRQAPQWNAETDVVYEEPVAPVRALAKRPPAKAPAERQAPSWNNDFSSNANPPEEGSQRTSRPREAPVKIATKTTTAAQSARGVPQRGARGPPPPPADEIPQVDEDEVMEFQRQKEEQARQFEEALNEAEGDDSRLSPCDLCGRTFREAILHRHRIACAKASKKRKVFDMTKARLEGIDGAEEILRATKRQTGKKAPPAPAEKPAGKMPKWKLQHQQFQAVLKMNKGGADMLSGPPIPMPAELDDRVPCPHCGRKFAHDTAERHIPKCQTTINKPKSLARPIRR